VFFVRPIASARAQPRGSDVGRRTPAGPRITPHVYAAAARAAVRFGLLICLFANDVTALPSPLRCRRHYAGQRERNRYSAAAAAADIRDVPADAAARSERAAAKEVAEAPPPEERAAAEVAGATYSAMGRFPPRRRPPSACRIRLG